MTWTPEQRRYIDQLRNVPEELRQQHQWLVFLTSPSKTKPGKLDKKPVSVHTGEVVNAHDPANWTTFREAVVYRLRHWHYVQGVAFVVTADDLFVGGDLDNCIDATGKVAQWAQRLLAQLHCYAEVSPSGRGIRFFCKGTLPPGGRRKGSVEIYESGRFLTVTGLHLVGTPGSVEERTEELAELHRAIFGVQQEETPRTMPSEPLNIDDQTLIAKAMNSVNGAKFRALWNGDPGNNASEADAALACLLAFWTARDRERMLRLMRQSGLNRDKWEKVHYGDGATYLEGTVDRALSKVNRVYDPAAFRKVA